MTNERGNPPSFTPGADRRPSHPEGEPIVVGGPTAAVPVAPVRRPTPPAGPRVSARPGGSARPIPRLSSPPSAPRTAEPWAEQPLGSTRVHTAVPDTSAPRRSAPATRSSSTPPPGPGTTNPRRTHHVRTAVIVLVVLLVLALAWPVGLSVWANKKIKHTDALSAAAGTPGTTYLIAGSDVRGDGGIAQDGTLGSRSDTILLLHVPQHGPTALISLPRDTYVKIDGHGPAKLNAAYAWGGAPLLVHTVEQLTGLKVDHFALIDLGGVKEVVDAVGGVNLCYPHDVNDADSGMVWTAGCHDVDGTQALAFVRMRKADPQGDIGRTNRQRQLIGAVMSKVKPASLVWHPSRQVQLIDAGTGALTFDQQSDIKTLASMALAFRAANGSGGVTGTPPIKSLNYQPGNIGSTVLLDPAATPTFFKQLRDGTLPAGTVGGIPG